MMSHITSGKFEKHLVDGTERELFVHRKGATRAFPAGHPEIPDKYQKVGQPGWKGSNSPVIWEQPLMCWSAIPRRWNRRGEQRVTGLAECSHVGKRCRSRKGRSIQKDLEKQGIFVRAEGRRTLHEEVPEAYKDVDEVVKVVDCSGTPLGRGGAVTSNWCSQGLVRMSSRLEARPTTGLKEGVNFMKIARIEQFFPRHRIAVGKNHNG